MKCPVCVEGRVGCAYDYGELDDEPCYSCKKGTHFKPRPDGEAMKCPECGKDHTYNPGDPDASICDIHYRKCPECGSEMSNKPKTLVLCVCGQPIRLHPYKGWYHPDGKGRGYTCPERRHSPKPQGCLKCGHEEKVKE